MGSAEIVFGVLLAHLRVLSRSDRNQHSKASHVITAHSGKKQSMINTTATRNSQNGPCLSNDEHKHMHQLNPTQPASTHLFLPSPTNPANNLTPSLTSLLTKIVSKSSLPPIFVSQGV